MVDKIWNQWLTDFLIWIQQTQAHLEIVHNVHWSLVSPPSASVNGGQLPWQVLGTLGTSYRSSCLIIITLQPNRLRIAVSRRLHFFQMALQIN